MNEGSAAALVLSGVLIALALPFLQSALYSGVQSAPTYPTCVGEGRVTYSCRLELAKYRSDLVSFEAFRSYVGVAEGFLVASATVLVAGVTGAKFLQRPLAPRLSGWLIVPVFALCASVFVVFAYMDASGEIFSFWNSLFGSFPSLYGEGSRYYGPVAFGSWMIAYLLLSARKGLIPAAIDWGIPAVLMLELLLLARQEGWIPNQASAFAANQWMSLHVTDFAQWSVNGVYILSNWFVLSLSLAALPSLVILSRLRT